MNGELVVLLERTALVNIDCVRLGAGGVVLADRPRHLVLTVPVGIAFGYVPAEHQPQVAGMQGNFPSTKTGLASLGSPQQYGKMAYGCAWLRAPSLMVSVVQKRAVEARMSSVLTSRFTGLLLRVTALNRKSIYTRAQSSPCRLGTRSRMLSGGVTCTPARQ